MPSRQLYSRKCRAKVISVASSENAVEITAACFTPMNKGSSDMETNPNPNPLNPWTKPAQASVETKNNQFIFSRESCLSAGKTAKRYLPQADCNPHILTMTHGTLMMKTQLEGRNLLAFAALRPMLLRQKLICP